MFKMKNFTERNPLNMEMYIPYQSETSRLISVGAIYGEICRPSYLSNGICYY